MRPAYYFLAVVLLALIGAAILFVVFTTVPFKPGKPSLARPAEVYVDLDRLMALHPAAATLRQMRELAAKTAPQPAAIGPLTCPPALRAVGVPKAIRPPEILRPEIEAEIAQSAAGAFNRLDAEQRQALQARLRAIRATMMESQRPQIELKAREIHETAVFKQRSLIGQLANLRLITYVNADSFQKNCDMYTRLIPPGPDSDPEHKIEDLCSRAQAQKIELGRIDRTVSSETTAIAAEARQKIAKLKEEAAAEVAAKIAAVENTEKAKIESEIAAARSEILPEISAAESVAGFEPVAPPEIEIPLRPAPSVTITPVPPPRPGIAARRDVAGLIASLRARIRSDVTRVVRQIAAGRGYSVTFTPTRGVPDLTARFARAIRECGPLVWGPVLAAGG